MKTIEQLFTEVENGINKIMTIDLQEGLEKDLMEVARKILVIKSLHTNTELFCSFFTEDSEEDIKKAIQKMKTIFNESLEFAYYKDEQCILIQ